MQSHLPSSFASAAAGQNANNRGGRAGSGSDWSRRANGTLTLRRSSTTPVSHTSQTAMPTDNPPQSPSNEAHSAQPSTYELSPARYTREELLAMAPYPRTVEGNRLTRLLMDGWNPENVNGGSSRAWGKSNENHIPQEPGACWDEHGQSTPLGHQPPTAEEREAFSTDINSPLKPPLLNKDATNATGVNGRKASLSHGAGNSFNLSSPSSATRPGTRRRETTDANPLGLNSPTAIGRTGREDSPIWAPRRAGDLRDTEADVPEGDQQQTREASNKLPFGNLMRSNTAGSAGVGSIWSQSNPATPSTGAGPSAGGFGNFALPVLGEKRTGGTGSRLAHLIPKDNAESGPGRQAEEQNPLNQPSWRPRQRTDTDPFGDDGPSGSAALGGAQETAAPSSQPGRVGTLGTPVKSSRGDFGMSGLNLGGHHDEGGPASPSGTNPYRSPPGERQDHGERDMGTTKTHPSFGQDASTAFNPLQRVLSGVPEGQDRSQTSSAGAKGFPIGHMSAWGAPGGPSSGTPDRERSNFAGGSFSPALHNPMGDIQSPSSMMPDLSHIFGTGNPLGIGSIGRGSKMGSLFPAAMQAQMQQAHEEGLGEPASDPRLVNPLSTVGNGFPMSMRSAESPMRANRGGFEDLFPSSDASRREALHSTAEPNQPGGTATASQSFTPTSGGMAFGAGQAGLERTMVMPDRMLWVYLDPQGEVQGPFDGLVMHDWFKANFFSPNLRVKKVEDEEFEPLGTLIRRIGNSREPFLVPQVGIPHGTPSSTRGGPASNNDGSVVPPLHRVFPSFGRTLTAEEQNNLERRKQEEQIMMAQQREYALRHNTMPRFPGQQPGLQHHSSAHSLHSQPSFGSITSPIGMPSQVPQQAVSGMPPSAGPGYFFDGAGENRGAQARVHGGSGNGAPLGGEDMAHLTPGEREVFAAVQAGQQFGQPIGTLGNTDVRSQLPESDELEDDSEGFKERLEQFHKLRAECEAVDAAQPAETTGATEVRNEAGHAEPGPEPTETATSSRKGKGKKRATDESGLSLTQQVQQAQVQQAQAAAAAAAAAAAPAEPGMPMPFPPPSSSTPLPAPTAQRARSNLPEQYNRSRTGSPGDEQSTTQPPPLAPWAKEAASDAHKGPSLKEIQEAEARKAAKAEEAAAALRKAALEQEASLLRQKGKQAASAAAGLPASSTWGHASPVSGAIPWAKPTAKAAVGGSGNGASATSKKTLAEIQREEELRKQKAKQAATQSGTAPPSASKSYANLAGKTGQPSIPSAPSPSAPTGPAGAGWATVGAGGKVKLPPTGPAAQTRSASASVRSPPAPAKPMSRPGPAAATSNGPATNTAMDEFRKWAHRELSRGINVPDIAGFISTLEALPMIRDIIAEAIYGTSDILDGNHFAEEFIRRKALADKGVVEKQPTDTWSGSSSGGWNEVAKKGGAPGGPPKDDGPQNPGFTVVPTRKKGKK